MASTTTRVRVSGKFFRAADDKWYAKGFCYGPFAPNSRGEMVPDRNRLCDDFDHIRRLGGSAVRVYYTPPAWVLDDALGHGLRLLVDVPWEKHRCFLEDWTTQQAARDLVRDTARRVGKHPAVFAISVGNEIPNDVVRFYGARRVQTFLDELIDIVHQETPDCLATYANFPTTEFLQPHQQDFLSFNIYLHDPNLLGRYLDRLQHLAGDRPLVVSEYGIDTIRHGEAEQASRLADYAETTFRHGVAGSFVFSYTDDWFTGGHQIEDWAFGVTRRNRREKRGACRLARAWNAVPTHAMTVDLPKVSVVVCSYNGGRTLEECLQSLMELNYPDYEVVLVDDGSTDDTRDIATRFPQVIYVPQANKGLSVARNVGLRTATGEVVAYTDADCVAEQDWLLYVVDAMRRQQVEGIGGPNITPASDNWTAKCVAASPGNPSHVMFDDQAAEHLPGCNMAFRREALLAVGGFDPQFRQAGDDVDLCWRLLARGYQLGFAAGAMVWHHRRCTATAYYRQQRGYGRAEAMLAFKHPQRFLATGLPRFDGVIYGEGKAGLPLLPPKVYHGRFGLAPFQAIYQAPNFRSDARAVSLEWHCLSGLLLLLATMLPPLAILSLAMWLVTARAIAASVNEAKLPRERFPRRRLMVLWLHLTQPIVRGLHRNGYVLRNKRLPQIAKHDLVHRSAVRKISASEREMYWPTTNSKGRCELLDAIVSGAKCGGWPGDFHGGWSSWDIELMADLWNHVVIRTATEELGWPKRFTRARWATKPTRVARAAAVAAGAWCLTAFAAGSVWGLAVGLAASVLLLLAVLRSRRRCLDAVGELIFQSARASGLADDERPTVAPPAAQKGKQAKPLNGHPGRESEGERVLAPLHDWHAPNGFGHASSPDTTSV